MIVVDSSAIFSVLLLEDDAVLFAAIFERYDGLVLAAPTLLECHFVVLGRAPKNGSRLLTAFLERTDVKTSSFDLAMAQEAVRARYRYGKGSRHAANLNLGDCFSYALAKTRNVPLLYKGDDFSHTDIVSALDVLA